MKTPMQAILMPIQSEIALIGRQNRIKENRLPAV
jgi:hypothetical protein